MSRASHVVRQWARKFQPRAISTHRSAGLVVADLTVKQHQRSLHSSRSCLLQLSVPLRQQSQKRENDDDDLAGNNTGSVSRFSELATTGKVDQVLVDTITKRMRLDTMTEVQRLTINEALTGVDVLAQAKTGTGKTIAFLLPVLQNILDSDPELKQPKSFPGGRRQDRLQDTRAIVISPTRELAEQIAKEASKLVQNTGVVVQNAVGGTQKSMHLQKMATQGCHLLVGTPGRLQDLFSDPSSGVKAPKLSALVLDEADRLMDQGFWPEIEQFQRMLPPRDATDRQTLLYSATVPDEVVKLARRTMKPNLHFVKTVSKDEAPTHQRVKQMRVSVPGYENYYPVLLELIQRALTRSNEGSEKRPFKAIVYFPSTAEVKAAAAVFNYLRRDHRTPAEQKRMKVFEIHSRLSQNQRTMASSMFRSSDTAILLSSDVTARGMDFPNVTHVIQMGLPSTRDAYIHRIGRTARAGAEGEGWLIHPSFMSGELKSRLGKLPLTSDTTFETAKPDLTGVNPSPNFDDGSVSPTVAPIFAQVRRASSSLDFVHVKDLYVSNFGTQTWVSDKEMLVRALNQLLRIQFDISEPPVINPKMAHAVGLNNVRGIRVANPAGDRFSVQPRANRKAFHGEPRPSFGSDRGRGDRRGSPGAPRSERTWQDRVARRQNGRR